jgi:hypothetical protein
VTLFLSNIVDNVQKQLNHYGLTALIGKEHLYDNLAEVLESYQKESIQAMGVPTSAEKNVVESFKRRAPPITWCHIPLA